MCRRIVNTLGRQAMAMRMQIGRDHGLMRCRLAGRASCRLFVILARLRKSMETFLISTAAVAIAEIGDKTQLLSLLLASVPS